MLDKTIDSALINLRRQIIRGNLDGLDQVNALLIARGIDPATHIVRGERKADAARRGIMRLMVLDALRDGPKRYNDIAAIIALKRPELTTAVVLRRTSQVLAKMQQAGLVKREGRLWGMA